MFFGSIHHYLFCGNKKDTARGRKKNAYSNVESKEVKLTKDRKGMLFYVAIKKSDISHC